MIFDILPNVNRHVIQYYHVMIIFGNMTTDHFHGEALKRKVFRQQISHIYTLQREKYFLNADVMRGTYLRRGREG